MDSEPSFDALLADLARAYAVRIPTTNELSQRGEIIEQLVSKVRREYTAERVRSLAPEQIKRECARLQRILEDLQCRLEVINEVMAEKQMN